jgi:hypothetical protein
MTPRRSRAALWATAFLAKIKQALRRAIFTDEVRPFVWVYYAALFAWGVYGTFFAAPATYVRPAMGDVVYNLWVWLHLIGTSIVMSGLYLEDRAGPSDDGPRNDLRRAAIRLQTGGHATMFFVLLAYELSAMYSTVWGEGIYSIFVISPYVIGCLMLAAQGIAKLTVKATR